MRPIPIERERDFDVSGYILLREEGGIEREGDREEGEREREGEIERERGVDAFYQYIYESSPSARSNSTEGFDTSAINPIVSAIKLFAEASD